MAKYVVTHSPIVQNASQEMLFKLLQEIAERDVPETEWISSWLAVDGSKMFCLWEAPGEDSIRAALGEQALQMNPIEALYEVVDVKPDYFELE